MITQQRLKELVNYDPDTGVFTWRVSRRGCSAGAIAGTMIKFGYIRIQIDRTFHLAHRLAFLFMTGALPADEVDHINGVRDDNRWVNLRHSTTSENQHNIGGAPRHNTSGYLGVSWKKSYQKWRAQIWLNGRVHHLGYFDDPAEAHAAYLAAKHELHPTHQRLRTGDSK